MTDSNPLKAFFRQPAIYIRLPSSGKFWPAGTLELTPTGEIGVMPMTAKDELTMKTPDALMNGQAIVDVIQSCIPSIKDAWACPSIDMEMVLAAIRIASYGEGLELSTICPCEKKVRLEYSIDLRTVVDFLGSIQFDSVLMLKNGLKLNLKPLSYREISKAQIKTWEQQKIFDVINNDSLSDADKQQYFNESFSKLSDITIETLTGMISNIETPDAIVDKKEYIVEFINNSNREIFSDLEGKIGDIKQKVTLKPMKVKCTEDGCDKEFDLPISLDQSNFFG